MNKCSLVSPIRNSLSDQIITRLSTFWLLAEALFLAAKFRPIKPRPSRLHYKPAAYPKIDRFSYFERERTPRLLIPPENALINENMAAPNYPSQQPFGRCVPCLRDFQPVVRFYIFCVPAFLLFLVSTLIRNDPTLVPPVAEAM